MSIRVSALSVTMALAAGFAVSGQEPVAQDVRTAAVILIREVRPFNYKDPIRLLAQADTTRKWPNLRARRFPGSKQTIQGMLAGNCLFFASRTLRVEDGTGDLHLGFADESWLRREMDGTHTDGRWVLVFEDGSYKDENLLLRREDSETYFRQAIDIVVRASSAPPAVVTPAMAGGLTGAPLAVLVNRMACARASNASPGPIISLTSEICN